MRIDGSTSPAARHEAVRAFQNNSRVQVALLGLTAASTAITLTAASL